jgi:hypothetical protein
MKITELYCCKPGDDSQSLVDLDDPPAWFTADFARAMLDEAAAAGDTEGETMLRNWLRAGN